MRRDRAKERPTSGTAEGLTLLYRGATIHLAADDPRLAFIELLLFGRPLPPPEPAPELPAPQVPAPPPEEPRVEVPRSWLAYWQSLPDDARRLLAVLSREPLTIPQLEQRLGVAPGGTRSTLILLAMRAKNAGLESPLAAVGRGRHKRLCRLSEEAAPVVHELDRRWKKVSEALEEARG